MVIELRGITWDHVRGVAPLLATSEEFHRLHPDVVIRWDKRSLKDFEDYPVELLAEKYDLIMLDHPSIGSAVNKGVLLPLDSVIPADFLREQAVHSVGPSFQSYTWEGQQWALAVDAAAQVCAYRSDLLAALGVELPKTWAEVFALAQELPEHLHIGIPLNPTHAFCSFYSLCANLSNNQFWDEASGVDLSIGEEALEMLYRLSLAVHPRSLHDNPIAILDYMAEATEILYIPLVFGYVNYARPGFRQHLIHFADIPSQSAEPVGGVIGGVGLSISQCCRHVPQAVAYLMYVARAECQAGSYFHHGGQPGHRAAWLNREVNEQANGFFRETLRTLDRASMRPRYDGFIQLQDKGGELLHHFLTQGGSRKETVQQFNQLYHQSRRKSN